MTFWELTRALLRFWVVLVLGAAITAGAGLLVIRTPAVYYCRAELVFLAPTSTLYPNALRTQSEDLIDTAGVVAKRVSGPDKVTKFASPDVTLVGMGIRDGWSLRLPDTGGQWATNFATQVLLLDIVGPTAEVVQKRQNQITGRVSAELDQLQRAAGVDPVNDITMIPAPESTTIHEMSGNRPRTAAMTALLGMGVTTAVVVVLHRRRQQAVDRAAAEAMETVGA
ncbi:hypothetical protein [Cumulibacter manganitolerans]|uniref:hypothetical protein n=1 Tax=Cumulibacter manganitolerans TaxID=1884992 RepID=UPI00188638D6|nr:hypothetical protein [Cumulibacter manganitolerans]